jgi:hypothetical protein
VKFVLIVGGPCSTPSRFGNGTGQNGDAYSYRCVA